VPDVPNGAADKLAVVAAGDSHGRAPAGFEGEALKPDMADVGCPQHPLAHREHGRRQVGRSTTRRPEVEPAGFAVEVVLAGCVELTEQVGGIPAGPVGGDAVLRLDRFRSQQGSGLGCDARERFKEFGPVVMPIGEHPGVGLVLPLFRAVGIWEERGRVDDFFQSTKAFIRPAGQAHRPILKEQFRHRRWVWPGEAVDFQRAIVANALASQNSHPDRLPGDLRQLGEDLLIGNRLPAGHGATGGEMHRLAGSCQIGDRSRLAAGILLGEGDRAVEKVGSPAKSDCHWAGDAFTAELPNSVAGTGQAGQGGLAAACGGVVS